MSDADNAQSRTRVIGEGSTSLYRAIVLAKGGTVINSIRLQAENDEQAIQQAKALVDGHAIEVWDGLRFIEGFLPIDRGAAR